MKRKDAPRCVDNALRIVNMFLTRKSVTSKMISQELGISVRTAQRYINDISAHMCVTRSENGYCLLTKLVNELPENDPLLAEAFYAAACRIVPEEKSGYLRNLKRTLGVPRERAVHLAGETAGYEDIKETARFMRKSVKEAVSVSFVYEKTGGRYVVSPYGIFIDGGFWYLIACSQSRIKTFRLDFIKDASVSPEAYIKPDQKVTEIISGLTSVWVEKDGLTVRVILDEEIADYFLKGNILKISKIISLAPTTLDVKAGHIMELYRKLAPFTPYYEIVTPEARAFFHDRLQCGAKRHVNQ